MEVGKTPLEGVQDVNQDAFSKNKKFKLKLATIAASIVIVGTSAAYAYSYNNVVIPEGYDVIPKYIYAYNGVTIDSVANLYYTDDAKEAYPSLEKYKKLIIKNNQNVMQNDSILDIYISVPVVVSKQDPTYIKMQEVLEEVEQVKKENYWLIAIPSANDTILKYALMASSNDEETLVLAQEIAMKNGFSSMNISLEVGKSIWVVNPRLGELKEELKELQEKMTNNFVGYQNLTKNNKHV